MLQTGTIICYRRTSHVELLTPDLKGRYGARCPHGHIEAWPSLAVALIATRTPEDWCYECWEDQRASEWPTMVILSGRRPTNA